MTLEQAVEVLDAKAETNEERFALALIVLELDSQFNYGFHEGTRIKGHIKRTLSAVESPVKFFHGYDYFDKNKYHEIFCKLISEGFDDLPF